jgi:hypothetical protein
LPRYSGVNYSSRRQSSEFRIYAVRPAEAGTPNVVQFGRGEDDNRRGAKTQRRKAIWRGDCVLKNVSFHLNQSDSRLAEWRCPVMAEWITRTGQKFGVPHLCGSKPAEAGTPNAVQFGRGEDDNRRGAKTQRRKEIWRGASQKNVGFNANQTNSRLAKWRCLAMAEWITRAGARVRSSAFMRSEPAEAGTPNASQLKRSALAALR